jgi:hypothetical protein
MERPSAECAGGSRRELGFEAKSSDLDLKKYAPRNELGSHCTRWYQLTHTLP